MVLLGGTPLGLNVIKKQNCAIDSIVFITATIMKT